MNEPQIHPKENDRWTLQHAPTTDAPNIAAIRSEIDRRKRSSIRSAGIAAGILFLTISATAARHMRNLQHDALDHGHDLAHVAPAAQPTRTVAPGTHVTPGTQVSPDVASDGGFTLLADVHLDTPVFQYDDRRDAMVPIGWIRSSDTVPVDLKSFSRDQIETFQTILRHETTNDYF